MTRDKASRALAVLSFFTEHSSGYRSFEDHKGCSRPLTSFENSLVDTVKELLEEAESRGDWQYRAAQSSGDFLETWGPNGDPDRSWVRLSDAEAAAAEDNAFVVRRRGPGPWEPVDSDG